MCHISKLGSRWVGSLSKSQTWTDSFSPLYTSISFRLNSLDELMRGPRLLPLLFALSTHRASSPPISSVSGCLGRPRPCSESGAEEGDRSEKCRWEPRKIPQGSRDQLAKVVPTQSLGTLLSLKWLSHPTPARPQLPGLAARVGLRGHRIRSDLPSRRWAAGGEARTSTQPASSRVSNFLGGAFAESLFLQKHRSTWHPLYRTRSALSSLDTNEIRHPMTTRARLHLATKQGKRVVAGRGGPKNPGEGGRKNWKTSKSSAWNQRARGPQAGGRKGGRMRGSLRPALLRWEFPCGGDKRWRGTQSRVQAGSEPKRLWRRNLP